MTQADLGRAIGKDRSWVWHWENGDFAPSWKMLPTVAAALSVSVAELTGLA